VIVVGMLAVVVGVSRKLWGVWIGIVVVLHHQERENLTARC